MWVEYYAVKEIGNAAEWGGGSDGCREAKCWISEMGSAKLAHRLNGWHSQANLPFWHALYIEGMLAHTGKLAVTHVKGYWSLQLPVY